MDTSAPLSRARLAPGRTAFLFDLDGAGRPDDARAGGDRGRISQPPPRRGGTLVLVQRGDEHEIRNTGETPLRTLNVYVPPAYTGEGEELPAGRS